MNELVSPQASLSMGLMVGKVIGDGMVIKTSLVWLRGLPQQARGPALLYLRFSLWVEAEAWILSDCFALGLPCTPSFLVQPECTVESVAG